MRIFSKVRGAQDRSDMKKAIVVWAAAFVVTAASAWYQRVTGPTYPLSGTASLGGRTIHYRLERSHGGNSDAPVALVVPDSSVKGRLEWRRYRSDDEWTHALLNREGEVIRGSLPLQPPSGKLQYRVRLFRGADSLSLPPDAPALLRFKGDVPPAVLAVHIFLMFAGMLLSTRTGLSALSGAGDIRKLTLATIALLGAGGLILGPVVQKYAFGAYWTGWPFGSDLTDNKTVAALAAWISVALVQKNVRRPRLWALAAALITLAVFMIPHSLFGSELDYGGGRTQNGCAPPSVSLFTAVHANERAADRGGHGRERTAHGAPHDFAQLEIGDGVLAAEIHLPAPLLTEGSPHVLLLQVDQGRPADIGGGVGCPAE